MASEFDTIFEDAFNPSADAMFSETVAYTVAGGSPSNVTAIVPREERARIFSNANVLLREEMPIYVSTSDVASPVGIAEASGDGLDSMSIDSTTFYVIEIEESDIVGYHRLRCSTEAFV